MNLNIQTLQCTHVNEHRYITSIVQRHRHEIDQLNNCVVDEILAKDNQDFEKRFKKRRKKEKNVI